jgi:hypothetical protein
VIADLTMRDLTREAVRKEARADLRKAQDFGGAPERAAWVDKWGEALAHLFAGSPESIGEDGDW